MRTRVRRQVLMGALLGFGATLAAGALVARRTPRPVPTAAPVSRPARVPPMRGLVLERVPLQDGVGPVREDGGARPRPLLLRTVEPVQR